MQDWPVELQKMCQHWTQQVSYDPNRNWKSELIQISNRICHHSGSNGFMNATVAYLGSLRDKDLVDFISNTIAAIASNPQAQIDTTKFEFDCSGTDSEDESYVQGNFIG